MDERRRMTHSDRMHTHKHVESNRRTMIVYSNVEIGTMVENRIRSHPLCFFLLVLTIVGDHSFGLTARLFYRIQTVRNDRDRRSSEMIVFDNPLRCASIDILLVSDLFAYEFELQWKSTSKTSKHFQHIYGKHYRSMPMNAQKVDIRSAML